MFNGDGKIPTTGSKLPVGNVVVKFHEHIPYGLGLMSQTLRKHYFTWSLVNSKTELARVVFLVPDISSRYDLAICNGS